MMILSFDTPGKNRRSGQGFTLIELSIVLTIIGLITGGVLVGTSLKRSAQLRSAISDIDSYKKAIVQFQTKYNALPGDMATATAFWGIAGGSTGNDSTCLAVDETAGTATCNGNGDGNIDYTTDGTTRLQPQEKFLMWKHLANAGLINGIYSGIAGGASISAAMPGTNVPLSAVEGAGYTVLYEGIPPASANWLFFAGNYAHIMMFGGQTGYETGGPVLTVQEALAIDSKTDDGLPGTGLIRSPASGYQTCATTSSAATAVYSIVVTGPACALFFILGF